jgi:hypothetical protein
LPPRKGEGGLAPHWRRPVTQLRALGLQFGEGAAVVLRHDLDKGGDRIVPVLEGWRARALPVKRWWRSGGCRRCASAHQVAHAAVDDADRALARALSSPPSPSSSARFEIDPAWLQGREAAPVVDMGDPARHPGGEVAPGLAEDDDDPAGRVFAAMAAGAFDDRDRAGLRPRSAPATLEIGIARDRPGTVLPTMMFSVGCAAPSPVGAHPLPPEGLPT